MNTETKMEFEPGKTLEVLAQDSDDQDKKPSIRTHPPSRDKKYMQRYSVSWEKNPLFKDWLSPVADDSSHAYCKFCNASIMAKKKSLVDHLKSRKHQKATQKVSLDIPQKQFDINFHPTTFVITILEKLMKGPLLLEGKKKNIFSVVGSPALVVAEVKEPNCQQPANDMPDDSSNSNSINAKVFSYLNQAGMRTSFLKTEGPSAYSSRKCDMIPLQFVVRRAATEIVSKRYPGLDEGYRFRPPRFETFLKEPSIDNPILNEDQIIEAGWTVGGIILGRVEYNIMMKTALAVFETLERAWKSVGCALIDLKMEFGVDFETKDILVANYIDNDCWKIWLSTDRRLNKDKQVYRQLDINQPLQDSLDPIKSNAQFVSDKLDSFLGEPKGLVVIMMASQADQGQGDQIRVHCEKFGLKSHMRISSAHLGTSSTLQLIAEYEDLDIPIVFITVSDRNNGLGSLISGNTLCPVINCPIINLHDGSDNLISLSTTSLGTGCATVLHPEDAAQHAASILAVHDHVVWSKERAKMLNNWRKLVDADRYVISQVQASQIEHTLNVTQA